MVGPGTGISLTACLLPLSQSPLSSPFVPWLGGPGGEGGELSGATTPCHRGLGRSSSQGWALDAPGQRVPLPSAVHTRYLVEGNPKAILGRAPEEVQPRPPQGWQPPASLPHPPAASKAQSNSPQVPEPASACFPTSQSLFFWPSPCYFRPWFSFQIGGSQEALQGHNGRFPCGQLQAPLPLLPLWQGPILGRGPGAGPRVQPSSLSFPSLNSINPSTPLL